MKSKVSRVLVPRLGANEDTVRVVEWHVADGDQVVSGQVLVTLESTKATLDVEAEENGYVYRLVDVGHDIPVQQVLAFIAAEPNPSLVRQSLASDARSTAIPGTALEGLRLTKKAREMIEELGVDVSRLPRGRIVREDDVQAILNASHPVAAVQAEYPVGEDVARKVAVYGASQGGRAAVESIRAMGGYDVVGFFDDTAELIGTTIDGLPVWAGVSFEEHASKAFGAVATHIAVREFRLALRDRARACQVGVLNVIHPRAYVSPSARLGVGNLIKAGAIIDTAARIGDCCIIDNGAIVAHDNVLADGVHLAPGVSMAGDCRVGPLTLIGTGATVSARVRIGRNVIVSPGAVVDSDVPDGVIVAGVPAQIIGQRRGNAK